MLLLLFLSLFLASAPVSADSFWHKVTWTTSDGVELAGLYHRSAQPKALTWVLLHGLGSSKGEWDVFARRLAAQGGGVFLYDMRGHADSVHLSKGGTIDYKAWQTAGPGSPWAQMPSDMESAVTALQERMKIRKSKIAVGGASLGANVALVYAAQHPEVPAVVLLSPGVEYAGVNIQKAWTQFVPRRVMLAASPGDQYAFASVQQMCQNSTYSSCPMIEGDGSNHGVNMFNNESFVQKLLEWMKKAEPS